MRKYYYFFRNRFYVGLQYRSATLISSITQFLWGLMECLAYKALLESNVTSSPMEYSSIVSYIWLKEAFLILFNTWNADNDIFGSITDGGIAYEMCRPLSIYTMWFSRNVGGRLASVGIRCIPILLGASLVPLPYRMHLPVSIPALLLFIITLFLGLGISIAFCMIVYFLCFFTISSRGVRMVMTGAVDLLSGAIIPIPFIPYPIRNIFELLPFASMMDVPLRIYSGDISGRQIVSSIVVQVVWLFLLIAGGKLLCRVAERKVVVQGG